MPAEKRCLSGELVVPVLAEKRYLLGNLVIPVPAKRKCPEVSVALSAHSAAAKAPVIVPNTCDASSSIQHNEARGMQSADLIKGINQFLEDRQTVAELDEEEEGQISAASTEDEWEIATTKKVQLEEKRHQRNASKGVA
ncbi:hypothetical protein CDL15_Pgr022222 [Punica granatum]|uniref:Uncharacterized protein n=1 Tax=Punica granatum TaxID=22663 RepID=A0A218WNY6_PUNGR|nr:hypothetical protein CDL15_Pgr022222 [Punica granatum]